ncbi:MBOAT family O-acyltransferase [Clostridium sp. OS1-26]|uniref:MBOAT family O-acyltransferase n=1 Tax=Clostridium sp. OS1-26 TaxID=3070681 RepID=UPI0027E1445E|nr:MBOAT family O-acyltransferase [Clostridium sp. OS1-26]WML33798.1 MBOAT family O-acyltransferase [Clostridium sp. OS1-26]
MSFNSTQFLLFFFIVVVLYYAIPNRIRWIWLLVVSYYFYMTWNPKYVFLIIASTLITYVGGLLINKAEKVRTRKLLVFLSISSNLGILFMFKYYVFFSTSITRIFYHFHIAVNMSSFDFMLPVGISFYTFQALSYIIDVYRKDIKAEKNFWKYALFVSFFPQLLSGPIQKSKHFMKQIDENHYFSYNNVKSGLLLMLWGYFQKTMVADRIGNIVNTVYGNPANYRGFVIVIATVFFAFQLYCDFSSYSNIAIGAAQVMGFRLSQNFESPYFSKSIREFWKRWHMSLTSWFMDYLYFPLGGSRCSKLRKYFNVMVVFIVSGLWHGSSFSFIVWGALHGIYYVIENLFIPVGDILVRKFKIRMNSFGYKLSMILINFILVDFAWLFFRATSFKNAVILIKNMFYFNPSIFVDGSLYKLGLDSSNFLIAMLSLGVVFIVDLLQGRRNLRDELLKQNTVFRWSLYLTSVIIILIFGVYGSGYNIQQFIYSKF